MREVEWEACLLEPRRDLEVERRVRRRFGRVGASLAYFSDCPWLSESLAALNAQLFRTVRLDHDLAEMAGVIVSHDNACRYCYAATRAFLRLLGYSEQRIHALAQDLLTAEFRPTERAAFDYARRVSRANPLPTPADAELLRAAGFDDLAIKELAGYVALIVFHNRLSTLAALPPQHFESLPDRWYMQLLRPVVAASLDGRDARQRKHGCATINDRGPSHRWSVLSMVSRSLVSCARSLMRCGHRASCRRARRRSCSASSPEVWDARPPNVRRRGSRWRRAWRARTSQTRSLTSQRRRSLRWRPSLSPSREKPSGTSLPSSSADRARYVMQCRAPSTSSSW